MRLGPNPAAVQYPPSSTWIYDPQIPRPTGFFRVQIRFESFERVVIEATSSQLYNK